MQGKSDLHSNSYTGQTPSLPLAVRNLKGKTSREVEQRGLADEGWLEKRLLVLFVTHFGPCARPARISRPRLGAGRKRPTRGDLNKNRLCNVQSLRSDYKDLVPVWMRRLLRPQ